MSAPAAPIAPTRRIVAWTSVSLDGCTSGPDGPAGDTWLYQHAGQPATLTAYEGVWRNADTALLGRVNYEGFHAVWPDITADPATDPRTRDIGEWLERVEKVVVSTTLEEAAWANSRIARDLEAEVCALREQPGRDVLVVNSASVIQELLRLDLLDDLWQAIVPTIVGGGLRLLPEGLPTSRWSLTASATLAHGAIVVHHQRDRTEG